MVNKHNKGFTLVETLVAMFLLAILLIGLLAGLITAYDISTKNALRDEAVKIAQEYSEKYRSMKYENINIGSQNYTIMRPIRNSTVSYAVNINTTSAIGGNMKKINITVSWNYKGKTYSYTTETLIRKEWYEKQ